MKFTEPFWEWCQYTLRQAERSALLHLFFLCSCSAHNHQNPTKSIQLMAYHLFMHLFILLHHSQKQIHGLLSINNSRRGSKLNSSSLHKTVALTQFLHICCWVAEAACNLLAFFILLWTTYCIEQATRAQESCFGCVIASICRLQFQNQGCLSAKSDQVVQKPGICWSYEYNMNARLETGLWFL